MPSKMVSKQTAKERSGILYQNEKADAILLDVPLSIAAAQACPGTLLSTSPLDSPFEMVDRYVQQDSTTKKNAGTDNELQLHEDYKTIIAEALDSIQKHFADSWCAPRELIVSAPKYDDDKDTMRMDIDDPEKDLECRLKEWTSKSTETNDMASNLQMMMASLGAESSGGALAQPWIMSYVPSTETQKAHDADAPNEPFTSAFHNAADHTLAFRIGRTQPNQVYRFIIPPRSSFFLSDCSLSDAFRASFRDLTDAHNLPRHSIFFM